MFNIFTDLNLASLVNLVFKKDSTTVTLRPNQTSTLTAPREVQLPPGDQSQELVSKNCTQIITNKDLDGGTASNTSRITVPKNTTANLAGLTRKEATLVYDTTTKKLNVDDGSNLVEVGSGTSSGGSGVKNYMLNPSAATSAATNWTAANVTVTRDTSTAIPRETTTKTAFKLVSTAGGSTATFISDAMLLDDTDLSKKLAVELAINVADASNWTIDILAATFANKDILANYVRLPLSTDVAAVTTLPATVGVFQTTVDTVAATPYLKFVITSVTSGKTAYFSDILLSPDKKVVVGSVVGPNTSYTPSIVNVGTASNVSFVYYRDGENLQLRASWINGTGGSGAIGVPLPSGLTINSTAVGGGARGSLGKYWSTTSGATFIEASGNSGAVFFDGSDTSNLYLANKTASASAYAKGSVTGMSGDSCLISLNATIPIAEWVGSGTVNLAQNDVEYASNTGGEGTAAGTVYSNTSYLSYSSSGSNFVAVASTSSASTTDYLVRFKSPIQTGDKIEIRLQDANGGWEKPEVAGGLHVCGALNQADSFYGISWYKAATATDIYVSFGNRGACPNIGSSAVFGSSGQAWSTLTSRKWVVEKTSAGAAVGFSNVSANSSGLMPASNSNLDDATATRLGLKPYLHGTTYNGGNAPTVTLNQGGGTISSVQRALFIPYQMNDGSWRMRLTICVILSSATRTSATLAVNGIVAKNITGYYQTVVVNDTSALAMSGYTTLNTNLFTSVHSSATTTYYVFSGDIELDSKPTWAY